MDAAEKNEIERELDDAHAELDEIEQDLERSPYNAELQKQQAKLFQTIRDLEFELRQHQKQKDLSKTVFSSKDPTKRELNPALDILVDLYIDNKHITPTPGEFIRLDDEMNLVSEGKKTDNNRVNRLKAEITEMKQRNGKPADVNKLMDELAAELRPFKPHFYLTLSELSSLAKFTQFTQTYTGNARSPKRAEKNIGLLLNLIFSRKEIEFNGRKCQIAEFQWYKSFFPPFGYQTGRGYVPIRTVSADTLHFTFKPEDVQRIHNISNSIDNKPQRYYMEAVEPGGEPREPGPTYYELDQQLDAHIQRTYEPEFAAAVAKYGDIQLANHAALFAMPDAYYRSLSPKKRANIFVYEYLAYRFSIYHTLFTTDHWSIYSEFPYFSSSKKNSDLLVRLAKFAPDKECKDLVSQLAKFWLQEDVRSHQKTAEAQHSLQLLYWTRLYVQMKQRLEYMHLALNYTIIQVIIKEAIDCAGRLNKDQTIRCMSKISQNAMQKYFLEWDPHDLPEFLNPLEFPRCPENLPAEYELPITETIETLNGSPKPDADAFELPPFEKKENMQTEVEVMQEIDRLDTYFQNVSKSAEVRWYVSIYHNLPTALQCLFEYMQELQVYKYSMEMKEALADWTRERENMRRINAQLAEMLDNTCMETVMATLTDEPCRDKLKRAYNVVEVAAAKYVKRANMDDSRVEFHALKVEFDPWYMPLKKLQAAYTATFKHYRSAAGDLLEEISKIQENKKKTPAEFNRKVNQLDYAVDAVEQLNGVDIFLEPVAIPPMCKETNDYKKVTRYLNVLFDLLENKLLRGVMWDADFKYERPNTCPATFDNLDALLAANESFVGDFGGLDPMCVLNYVKVDLNDMDLPASLLETALALICKGKFRQGEEAVHLALLFKFPAESELYTKCRDLLYYLWMSRGKKLKADRIKELAAGEVGRRIYMLLYGKWYRIVSDKRVAERVIHFRTSSNSMFVNGKVKALLQKFKEYPNDSSEQYHAAYVNYKCMMAALGKQTAREILTDERLKEADLQRVLRYFPPEHNVSNVVAQIHSALNHEDFETTFEFVAKYVYRHRTGGRDVVYESKPTCPVLDVEPSLDRLRKTDEKLLLVEELTASVRTERENEWPKKVEEVTASIVPPSLKMLDRTQDYPYLDGNYTVRCVVTLKLLTEQKEAVTCDEKTQKVNDLAQNLLGFKVLPENKKDDTTTETSDSTNSSDFTNNSDFTDNSDFTTNNSDFTNSSDSANNSDFTPSSSEMTPDDSRN